MIECYTFQYKMKGLEDEEEIPIPAHIRDILLNALVYGTIWGVGGVIDERTRKNFDEFLLALIAGEDVVSRFNMDMGPDASEKYPGTKIPNKMGGDCSSIFDYYFDCEDMRWVNWLNTVPSYKIDKDLTYLQLSIPTIDSIRMNQICETLLRTNQHCLIVGNTGTGKSVQVNKLLKVKFNDEQWAYYQMGFSAQTTALQTERIIDGSMDKKRKGVYGPKYSKEGVIFVDDLNMPQKEKYGAQPPIEILRQWMDYKGWYDVDDPERPFRKLE